MFNSYRRRRDPFLIQEGKVSDPDIKGFIKKRWVEEAWTAEGRKGAPASLNEFLGLALSRRRLFCAAIFILLLILIVVGRLTYLQLWQGEHYHLLAEGNRLRQKPIPAERGLIYDRRLTPLTFNIPNFTLNLTLQDLPADETQREETLKQIADLSQVSLEEIKNKIEEFRSFGYRSIAIRHDLDRPTAILLTVAAANLPGLEIETANRRQYPLTGPDETTSLSHLLGYTGKATRDDLILHPGYLPTDSLGKAGLEKFYEKDLRGVYGKKGIETDALGKEKNVVAKEPPQAGKNLILTVDLAAQKKLEEILAGQLRTSGQKRGTAIALDPRNGEILALVNLPAFDNNLFSRGLSAEEYQKLLIDPDAPLFSRAWTGSYPSGSAIKPFIAAAALNEGLISRQTSFLSSGGLQVNRWFFPDWKAGGHGQTNVVKALAESVNTFFFIIGGGYRDFPGLGLEKITEYLKKFGFANTSGLDLPNENAGFIPSREWKEDAKKENWYIGDTYNLAIGQGDLLVSPLQIANATAILANGGVFYQPRLVKTIVDPASGEKTDLQPVILESSVLPDSILKIVREGLRAAVTSGSARSLAALPIVAAGKTGTAQWSKKRPSHAWFTGYAPADRPEIVLTVLIEEGGEGSQTAVPVAYRFFEWWNRTYPHPSP